jgi:hypothetical protein
MRGGIVSVKEYQQNLFNVEDLLKREDIIKLLKEAEKKEAEDKEKTITGLILKYGEQYIKTQLAAIEAASAAAEMASSLSKNPQALLEGQLGPMAGKIAGPMATKIPGPMAGQITSQIQKTTTDQLLNPMAELPNQISDASQMPNPMTNIMADKPQSGGKSNKNKNKLPNPIFPLLRTKEASIIGGRIESSISKFLG